MTPNYKFTFSCAILYLTIEIEFTFLKIFERRITMQYIYLYEFNHVVCHLILIDVKKIVQHRLNRTLIT